MPFCPVCEYEHRGKTLCPDCGTALVVTLDQQEEYICDECKEPMAGGALWCPHCGTILVTTLHCFEHGSSPARGKCIVCGQHVCGICGTHHMGQYFCTHDAQTGMEEGQVDEDISVYDWESEKFKRFLEQEHVSCRIFKPHDTRRGDPDDNMENVRLLASRTAKARADQILLLREVDLDVIRFECEGCSAVSSGKEPVCPNCGGE